MAVEWTTSLLEDLADEVTVGHVGTMANEYVDSGIPFLRSLNVDPLRINTNDLRYITPEFHSQLQKSRLRSGDVVIVRTGKPGACAVIPEWLGEANCSDLVIVRPGRKLNSRFIAYYVNAVAHSHVSAHLVGAVQQHFNVGSAKQMPVRHPPLNVQQQIVGVLGSLDDKIELNRRMNGLLEGMARAIFKAWFIDFEPVKAKAAGASSFPDMSQAVFDELPTTLVDSEVGDIPEGWEVVTVADLGSFVNGKAFTKHANGKGRMIIRIAELNSGPGTSTKYSDIDSAPENTAFPDDILFAWSGSLDVYRWHRDEAMINQHIFKVIPDQYPAWFVYYQLVEAMPFFKAVASTKATTMGHIKRGHLSQVAFAVPPTSLLQQAEEHIRPLYDLVHVNERESLVLAETRDTLLPKLISGGLPVGGGQ